MEYKTKLMSYLAVHVPASTSPGAKDARGFRVIEPPLLTLWDLRLVFGTPTLLGSRRWIVERSTCSLLMVIVRSRKATVHVLGCHVSFHTTALIRHQKCLKLPPSVRILTQHYLMQYNAILKHQSNVEPRKALCKSMALRLTDCRVFQHFSVLWPKKRCGPCRLRSWLNPSNPGLTAAEALTAPFFTKRISLRGVIHGCSTRYAKWTRAPSQRKAKATVTTGSNAV